MGKRPTGAVKAMDDGFLPSARGASELKPHAAIASVASVVAAAGGAKNVARGIQQNPNGLLAAVTAGEVKQFGFLPGAAGVASQLKHDAAADAAFRGTSSVLGNADQTAGRAEGESGGI